MSGDIRKFISRRPLVSNEELTTPRRQRFSLNKPQIPMTPMRNIKKAAPMRIKAGTTECR